MTNYDDELCTRDGSMPTELDIQAFVDGQLDASRLAGLHRYLRSRPDEARRVVFYDELNRHMQRRFRESAPGCGDAQASATHRAGSQSYDGELVNKKSAGYFQRLFERVLSRYG